LTRHETILAHTPGHQAEYIFKIFKGGLFSGFILFLTVYFFSSNQPLFVCISKNAVRATSSTSEAPNIRRLSPGYCIRVHRVSSSTNINTTNLSSSSPPLRCSPHKTIIANDISPQHFVGETTTTQQISSSLPISMLTISIGSGWGANYDQKSVSNLECRYEVIFT